VSSGRRHDLWTRPQWTRVVCTKLKSFRKLLLLHSIYRWHCIQFSLDNKNILRDDYPPFQWSISSNRSGVCVCLDNTFWTKWLDLDIWHAGSSWRYLNQFRRSRPRVLKLTVTRSSSATNPVDWLKIERRVGKKPLQRSAGKAGGNDTVPTSVWRYVAAIGPCVILSTVTPVGCLFVQLFLLKSSVRPRVGAFWFIRIPRSTISYKQWLRAHVM